MECLLGRKAEDALSLLAEQGIHPEIEKTGPRPEEEGILRVVQVLEEGARLRVSVFSLGN